jgi:tetratricopeptide (TPR) repeat protein
MLIQIYRIVIARVLARSNPGKIICVLYLSTCLFINGYCQSDVTLTEKWVSRPTYIVAPPDKNPIFYKNEAYQGAERHYYPLKLNDQYTNERVDKEWQTLVLENEYIELGVTPDIGGKLYYATDKTNNYHFIYKNNVVRPSNIGMTGAWVSGGIEWCVLHHHRASTFLPVDYTTTENPDGSKTIWVAENEPRHGMRWTIGITLFPGKSYFKAEGRIHNSSPFTHSFLNWANVAVHVNDDYQTIFPPSTQVVTFHSKTNFTQWPVANSEYHGATFNDTDISWWKNVESANSFFVHNLQEDFMGGYDHGKSAGTVHVGDHNIVKGAKLWEWGSGPSGQATEGRLTENDGPYAEIMVGAFSDNQPDYSWIKPYEVKHWEQYWYPIRGIQGFKYANLNGAVNLEEKPKNSVFLGYYSTGKVEKAMVLLIDKDKTVFKKNISISPDNPFTETIKLDEVIIMKDLYTQLINLETGDVLIEYQPAEIQPVETLPENWKGYPEPDKLETVEELYLTGKRVEQFYAPRYNPMDWYKAALEKDPGDIRTNTAAGNHYLKTGDYTTARQYFAKAIKRLTNDYTVPSSHEAFYLQGLTLRSLGFLAEAEDTLYRATWDYAWHSAAYFQLAEISCGKNDFKKALKQINESLSTNMRNNCAVALKASIQRRMRDFEGALSTLALVAGNDPLDFRIRNEYYLIAKESGDTRTVDRLLDALDKEMRNFDDNYLTLAVGYLDNGLLKEAEEALKRFKGKNPLFDYYLGYIYDKCDDYAQALKCFTSAAGQPVDYVFPYRLGTIDVLNTALKYNPTDGNAFYYIGNILYDKRPENAMKSWENAVKQKPELSVAYRNLGWGYYHHYNDEPKAIAQYEKAISLNKNEALYYTELSELYERNNIPIATRMKIFEGNDSIVKNRDDSYIWFIDNLILSEQAGKAVELLEGINFAYREGSSISRNIKINANLMLGKQYYEEKEYQKALDCFLNAQITKEAAGNDRLGDRAMQVDYFIGLAYEALGRKPEANASFTKSITNNQDSTSRERVVNVMNYYQGLSHAKLGNHNQAKDIFESLISEANKQLVRSMNAEVGVIFGGREASNDRMSRIYTMRGLGYKGLGELQKANNDLNKALELLQSNLWAQAELEKNQNKE